VISESLRQRLRLVATPWSGTSFQGADGTSFAKKPLGVCNFHLTLCDVHYFHSAVIFSSVVTDLILGWDFLSTNQVTIDCFPPIISDDYFKASEFSTFTASLCSAVVLSGACSTNANLVISPSLCNGTQVV